MKIKIIRPTIFRKKPIEPSETPIDVSASEAQDLIGAGKAVAVKESRAETTVKPLKEAEVEIMPEPEAIKPQVEAIEPEPTPVAQPQGLESESGKSKRKKKAGA